MRSAPSQPAADASGRIGLAVSAVFFVSAAVVGLELALMRCLSVAAWHHFAYLVISTALLGFGASGTLLCLVGRALERRFNLWSALLTLAFALSITLCFRAAQALGLDPRSVLYSGKHAGLMLAYHLLMLVPFLIGATVIGLSLMHFGGRVHAVYAASLTGSGAGILLMVLLMYGVAEVDLLYAPAAAAVAGAAFWSVSAVRACGRRTGAALGACCVLVGLALVLDRAAGPLTLRLEPYARLVALRRWESQSDARHVLTRHGPRARLDVYDSPLLHSTLFAGFTLPPQEAPPPQLEILADGRSAGVVFKIRSAAEAPVLDHTLMSVPYRLMRRPRVLLLGEAGGTNVWLAQRRGAQRVTVVQGNPQIIELMRGPLADMAGGVFDLPSVRVVARDPRVFLQQTDRSYDIIQVVTAEGMAAGVSSLLSLHEDYLLTREGLALCLRRLRPGGVVAITRGVQLPPRDNVRIFATLAEALEMVGADEPGRHLVQYRNVLGVTTLAFRTPLDTRTCGRLLALCEELMADVEWAPCDGFDPSQRFMHVPGPEGAAYSYFHYAAREILSPRREEFYRSWAYNVRPATDDSPYPYNAFRWRSLPLLREKYGKQWLGATELGYVVVAGALLEVLVLGAVLILLPLLWIRRGRAASGGRLPAAVYFLLLGVAFMLLEMAFVLKFTRFLGDPIFSAAGMIGAFLVFSGLGSAASRRLCGSPLRAIGLAAVGITCIVICYVVVLDSVFEFGASLAMPLRFGLSVLMVAPLAFLMGWPFPNGLACVKRARPSLVPWVWGVNGFASVAGAPLAVLLAVAGGLRVVMMLAAVLYAVAGLVGGKLPGARAGNAGG